MPQGGAEFGQVTKVGGLVCGVVCGPEIVEILDRERFWLWLRLRLRLRLGLRMRLRLLRRGAHGHLALLDGADDLGLAAVAHDGGMAHAALADVEHRRR